MGECYLHTVEVASSSLASPTQEPSERSGGFVVLGSRFPPSGQSGRAGHSAGSQQRGPDRRSPVDAALSGDTPDALLASRDDDKPGQTSKPEWGINISAKNLPLLEESAFEKMVGRLRG